MGEEKSQSDKLTYYYFIDLSSTNTGIVLLKTSSYKRKVEISDLTDTDIVICSICTKKLKFSKDSTKQQRQIKKIKYIQNEFLTLFETYPPQALVVEGIFIRPQFFASSEMLIKLHGMLIAIADDHPISFIAPSVIKKFITGHGNANKEMVKSELNKYNFKFSSLDESDAFAIMVTYFGLLK